MQRHENWRSKPYLAWVRKHRCIGCDTNQHVIAHHDGPDKGRGLKCSDMFTVPLHEPLPGGGCHGLIHRAPFVLPGLDRAATVAKILEAQWRLMSRWIAEDLEPRDLFPGDRRW